MTPMPVFHSYAEPLDSGQIFILATIEGLFYLYDPLRPRRVLSYKSNLFLEELFGGGVTPTTDSYARVSSPSGFVFYGEAAPICQPDNAKSVPREVDLADRQQTDAPDNGKTAGGC